MVISFVFFVYSVVYLILEATKNIKKKKLKGRTVVIVLVLIQQLSETPS